MSAILPYEYLWAQDSNGAVKVARRVPAAAEGAWSEVASFASTYATTTGFAFAACANEVLARTQTGSSTGVLQKSTDYGDNWVSDGFFAPASIMEVGGVGEAGFVLVTLNAVFFRAVGSTTWGVVTANVAAALGGTYGNSSVGQWTSTRGWPPFRFAGRTCFVFGQITDLSPYTLGNHKIIGTADGTTWEEVAVTYPAESPGPGNIRAFHGYMPAPVGDELWIPYATTTSGNVAEALLKLDADLQQIGVVATDLMDLPGLSAGSIATNNMLSGGGITLTRSFVDESAGCELVSAAGDVSASGVVKGPAISAPYPFGDGAFLGYAQATADAPGDVLTARIGDATTVTALSMSGTANRVAYAFNTPFASLDGCVLPNLVGMAQAAAESALTGAGFSLGTVTEQHDDEEAGVVIAQAPAAGVQTCGIDVALTVSLGPLMCSMPDLIGLSKARAIEAAEDAGFEPSTERVLNDAAAGTVVAQSLAAGTHVCGEQVTLSISSGGTGGGGGGDMTSFNCECEDVNDNLTLAEYRTRMMRRLGFATTASNPPPGMADMLAVFLQDAQNFLYYKYPALRTRRFFRWSMVEGERFYGIRENDENWTTLEVTLENDTVTVLPADLAGRKVKFTAKDAPLPEPLEEGVEYYLVLTEAEGTYWVSETADGAPLEFEGPVDADATYQPGTECMFNMEPYKNIEGAWIEDLNGTWFPMADGIPPFMYTTVNQPSLPVRFEIRQCVEVFPAPNNSDYKLWIKGHFGLRRFTEATDKPTIDGHLVYLWALSEALEYYGKPAFQSVRLEAREHLGSLTAGTHGSKRYIPGTRPLPPAVMPVLAPYPGQTP